MRCRDFQAQSVKLSHLLRRLHLLVLWRFQLWVLEVEVGGVLVCAGGGQELVFAEKVAEEGDADRRAVGLTEAVGKDARRVSGEIGGDELGGAKGGRDDDV